MGILVVGSVAFDSVRTPFGSEEGILGGSASYFSVAASYFTTVSIVAVVGEDFPQTHLSFFQQKGIDTSGLQRSVGKTFRWKGEYGCDLSTAINLDTQPNVFANFKPTMLSSHRTLNYLFLGNIDPDLQRAILEQMKRPKIVGCDSMDYWIDHKRDSVKKTLALVDILVINDAETRRLAGDPNLMRAGQRILSWGPKILVIKRGEYGALMINGQSVFAAPAFPVEEVVDPTGAGDSFAGGFMGYLAATGHADDVALRKGIVFGSVMASFNVSEFGLKRLGNLTYPEIAGRFQEFRKLTYLEDI